MNSDDYPALVDELLKSLNRTKVAQRLETHAEQVLCKKHQNSNFPPSFWGFIDFVSTAVQALYSNFSPAPRLRRREEAYAIGSRWIRAHFPSDAKDRLSAAIHAFTNELPAAGQIEYSLATGFIHDEMEKQIAATVAIKVGFDHSHRKQLVSVLIQLNKDLLPSELTEKDPSEFADSVTELLEAIIESKNLVSRSHPLLPNTS